MEKNEKQFQCTGDCLNCPRIQREYCSAQKGYDNQRILVSLQEAIHVMSGTIGELKEKISAIQDSEASVFNPNEDNSATIAQEGDGAEIDAPI